MKPIALRLLFYRWSSPTAAARAWVPVEFVEALNLLSLRLAS